MAGKSSFNRLDAFTKTVEDARVRTTSGGIVTIVSLLLITYLVYGEWADYRRINVQPLLVVDKGRGDKMEIHMNISFPRMPCELLTLDVMDVSGAIQTGVISGITKTRLKPEAEGGGVISSTALQLNVNHDDAPKDDPNYCGSCYSADPPPNAKKPGCCQTCEEVRAAYAAKSWAFGRGQNVEQCERAHYAEHLDEQRREGCRIDGGVRVNKVAGNFHFAPGPAVDGQGMHMHDIKVFLESSEAHTFTHDIHHLRFGPVLPEKVIKKLQGKDGMAWTNHHVNPLDESNQDVDVKEYNFMYFIKVVPTAYLPLGWDKDAASMWSAHSDVPHDLIELGQYGYGESGSVETHQYSVTSHKRHLGGGEAKEEGHSERYHAMGGLPGVWFNYDISPMKVINKEQRNKSFSAFLFGVCAVIGGTLTVAAAIDRALYEGSQKINKVKDR